MHDLEVANWLMSAYLATLSMLAVYGLLGLVTLYFYYRHRQLPIAQPCSLPNDPPLVTVQLPLYNERLVVERLISAAVRLDYPRHLLQIQIIDDSTDETSLIAAQWMAHYKEEGFWVEHIQRPGREGYKAGALQAALPLVQGKYVALFDADFVPPSQFLQRSVPYLEGDPSLGMVQARWGHLNADDSPLTAAQAIALDKHFAIEQTVRHRANLFPKFNGAAGIWRRRCIEEAGGWESDTVTEDLCLSTRAILAGWQFRFQDDLVAPAELPSTIAAYKNQQARWAKGSTQCLLKFGKAIFKSKDHSLAARLYALLSMSAYSTHLLLVALLLLVVPLTALDVRFSPRMIVFGIAGVGQPLLFVISQHALYADWRQRLRHLPTLLLIAIGIAPSTGRAILQVATSSTHRFVRTPKGQSSGGLSAYRLPSDQIVLLELLLAAYAFVGLGLAVWRRNPGPLFLLITCSLGFSYVAYLTLSERR